MHYKPVMIGVRPANLFQDRRHRSINLRPFNLFVMAKLYK